MIPCVVASEVTGALRYLVVDELHTFDGAQGTDLACLIRRLRSRLGVARERLIFAGTSATIGGEDSREELLDYVSRIFDQPFEPDAIVGEVRQGIDEFLGRSIISRSLLPRDDLAARVDHTAYTTVESYVRAQQEVFFGESVDGDIDSADCRVALAQRLREHLTFVNLLRVLEGRPKPLSEIVERLRPSLLVASDAESDGVLNGLCALISVARRLEDDTLGLGATQGNDVGGTADARKLRPFLQVGLQRGVSRRHSSTRLPPVGILLVNLSDARGAYARIWLESVRPHSFRPSFEYSRVR